LQIHCLQQVIMGKWIQLSGLVRAADTRGIWQGREDLPVVMVLLLAGDQCWSR